MHIIRSKLCYGNRQISTQKATRTLYGLRISKHLLIIKILRVKPACKLYGDIDEAAQHIIFECEALARRRFVTINTNDLVEPLSQKN